jgi:hypothetical protein
MLPWRMACEPNAQTMRGHLALPLSAGGRLGLPLLRKYPTQASRLVADHQT